MATYTEVVDALIENADFEEVNSLAKAKAFITAANRFFILVPEDTRDHEGNSARMSVAALQDTLQRARSYVAANDANSGSVRFLGVAGDFR